MCRVKIKVEVYDSEGRLIEEMCRVLEELDRADIIEVASSWLRDRLKVILATCALMEMQKREEGRVRRRREGVLRQEHILDVLKDNTGKYLTTAEIVDMIERKYGYRPRAQAVALLLVKFVKERKYKIEAREREGRKEWRLLT